MVNNSQGNSRIARNTLFLYIRMFFVLIVTLYTSRVILSVLGVVDFGVNNVVAGFVTMFAFLNSSLTGAIQRYYNFERSTKGDEGIRNVYKTSIIIQASMAVLVFVLLEAFGVWYVNNVMVIPPERLEAANILFQVSVVSLALLIMSIPFSAAIVSFEHMDYYAFVGILDVVLKLAIVLVLPYINYDKLITYSVLLFSVSIANFLLYSIYAKRKFTALKLNGIFDKGLLKSMLVFSGWNAFGTFSNVVYTQGVNLLLNFFFGPVVNAARGVSNYISGAVHGFSANIVIAFRPQLVESYAQKNYQRTRTIMYSESKICYLMILLLITPIIIEMDYILDIWLGNNIPEYTAIFAICVLLKMLITTLNVPFSQVVHASGVMKKFQIITSVITCMIIPLGWIVFKLGMPPVSIFLIAILLAVVSQIACIIIVKGIFEYNVKEYLAKVIGSVLLVTLIAPIIPYVIHCIWLPSIWRALTVVVLSSIIICALSYTIVLDKNERQFVVGMVKKFLKKK